MNKKNIITENRVILNKNGEIEFQLTEASQKLGYFSIDEGKRLGAQIIQQMAKKHGIQS